MSGKRTAQQSKTQREQARIAAILAATPGYATAPQAGK
jgi:hypothetical protein